MGSIAPADGQRVELLTIGDTTVVVGGAEYAAENDGEVPVDGIDVFSPRRLTPDWMED